MHAHKRITSRHPQSRRHRPGSVIGTILGATVVFAVTVTMLLSGLNGSYALWNGKAVSNAGTISAGTNTVSESLTVPLTYTYKNGQSATTGGVLVTNTGNVSAQYSTGVTLKSGSSALLAGAVTVKAWQAANLTTCNSQSTVPSGAYTGTWASIASATASPVTGTLAAGASFGYCLRTTMNVTSATGIASGSFVTPVFTTAQTVGGTWTSTAAVNATQSFVDDIAPAAPIGLRFSNTSTTATTVSWTASTDNVGVAKYLVQRGGVTVASVSAPTTTYVDSTLSAGTTYTYTVIAQDAVGNSSGTSTSITVTTAQAVPTLMCTQPDESNVVISWNNPSGASWTTIYDVLINGAVVADGTQSYWNTSFWVTTQVLSTAGITSPTSGIPVIVREHGKTAPLFTRTISAQTYWSAVAARCGS